MHLALVVVGVIALVAAFSAQMLRWLRVLQREHYQPTSMVRFLERWSSPPVASATRSARLRSKRPLTLSHVLLLALVATVLVRNDAFVVAVTVAYGVTCPWGLSIKGRTSPLHWTRRLTMITIVASAAALLVALAATWSTRPWLAAVAMVWAVPLLLDVSVRALAPIERRSAQRFVDQATTRLARVHPRVVAITGSYGKTSTKNHLSDLLGSDFGVVASPRSFNNRAGLSRAINENLTDGTRVFIAEMGTYGPGEIRELCSWCVPEIAVVTAIGPVHLERMKSLEVIERAKFEITERCAVVIVNIDDARLEKWPGMLAGSDKRVRSAGSTNGGASVRVIERDGAWTVVVDGEELGSTSQVVGVQATNLACAIAAALELGLASGDVMARLAQVTPVANRLNVVNAPSGVVVIDDTFNANPQSALAALKVLLALPLSGRRVVVTPGLIELGRDQYGENLSLARKVAFHGVELVVVGRTNAVALAAGYEREPLRCNTRDDAVAWVRSSLVAGDGVLYLNDLPDHYP